MEVEHRALTDPLYWKIEPKPVNILGVVTADPYGILHDCVSTVEALIFSAKEQLPLSKLESMVTLPKVNVLCDGGTGKLLLLIKLLILKSCTRQVIDSFIENFNWISGKLKVKILMIFIKDLIEEKKFLEIIVF